MVIIPGTGSWMKGGAIVPDERELKATIHALIEERDRVACAHGTHYGEMTLQELEAYILQLRQYQEQRGA